MMTRAELIDKKNQYELKKKELSEKSYEAEIEAQLKLERERLTQKYEAERKADEVKVDHYLELLSELIADATRNEVMQFVEDTENTQT